MVRGGLRVTQKDPSLDSDVVVVGAGPSGTTTASYIARAGFNVILVDQQNFPREKICGDFISPVAMMELEKLGITDVPEYRKANVIRTAALYLNGKRLISKPIPLIEELPSHGLVIPRVTLDNLLLNSAVESGVRFLEGLRFVEYQRSSNRLALSFKSPTGVQSLRTKLLIGADGSNSVASRLLRGHSPSNDNRIMGVRAYFEGVEGPPDRADLYFTSKSFPGYCWLFPTNESQANVGVGMALNTFPCTDTNLLELISRLIKEDPALHGRLHKATMTSKATGWPLTTYNPRLPIVGDRIMLVGDAAGLINPLNGEGIQNALLSGRWASDVATSCITRNDLSEKALSAYSDRVERELRYDMALSSLIVQLIRNRSLNPMWLYMLQIISSRARIDSEYARITGGILAGLVPASEAVSVKIIDGTLKQMAFSTTLNTALTLLRGRRQLTKASLGIARNGFDIALNTMIHPLSFMRWGWRSVAGAAELATQFYKHSIRNTEHT